MAFPLFAALSQTAAPALAGGAAAGAASAAGGAGGLAGLFGQGGGMSIANAGARGVGVGMPAQESMRRGAMQATNPATASSWSERLAQLSGQGTGGNAAAADSRSELDRRLSENQAAGAVGEIGKGLSSAFGGPYNVRPMPAPYRGPQVGPNVDPGQTGLMALLQYISRGR